MKTHKLLRKLSRFLHAKKSARRHEIKKIREVLGQLKEKEQQLQEKLSAATEMDERNDLEEKLKVVHAQRLKGVERMRELRSAPEDP